MLVVLTAVVQKSAYGPWNKLLLANTDQYVTFIAQKLVHTPFCWLIQGYSIKDLKLYEDHQRILELLRAPVGSNNGMGAAINS